MKKQLVSFEDDKDMHDIVLIVEGKKFYCSKINLARHSGVLKSLLIGPYQERDKKEIELKEVSAIDFNNFLLLIHGASEVDDDNVKGLLELSNRCLAPAVLKRCSEFLMYRSKKNIRERFELAAQYGFEDAKKFIIGEISNPSKLSKFLPKDITVFDRTSMALLLEKSLKFHGITPGKKGTEGHWRYSDDLIRHLWSPNRGSYETMCQERWSSYPQRDEDESS
ncbi:unnamed protein product [Caenorhabditis brenneri]